MIKKTTYAPPCLGDQKCSRGGGIKVISKVFKGYVHLPFPQKLAKVNVNVIVHGKWVRNLEFHVLVQDYP